MLIIFKLLAFQRVDLIQGICQIASYRENLTVKLLYLSIPHISSVFFKIYLSPILS